MEPPVVSLTGRGIGGIDELSKLILDIIPTVMILSICTIPMAIIADAIKITIPSGLEIFK